MLKNFFQKKTKYQKLINQINLIETDLKLLTDSELRKRTSILKNSYQNRYDLTYLIPEAFALTREASLRTLGLRHYDVQLFGGLILNSSKIAEMRTGEGKTLVATLPAFLNSLTGKGVHIVTVNEYLANRDQVSMGQLYRFLGISTGLIQERMNSVERRENYQADITYVTNNELGFDYLRDNMASHLSDVVLRSFNYCIIDEIDSVLIDEAQTPLIIANSIKTSVEKYIIATELINYLEINIDFKVDEKNNNVLLTTKGTRKIETILGIKDLYNPTDPWIPFILNALKAFALVFCDVQYIIQNNRVIIVDEFTGRIMPERRWSDGLHQAIEAKEGVPIRQNTEAIASITYQNFFLLYPKLSGMTGTAKTAEVEFDTIYNLPVNQIPTARPNLRKDLPDFIFKDDLSKWKAIANECQKVSKTKQPILIGTTTIEKSELLAQLLHEYKLSYQILNAKPENGRKESEVIAQAGKLGSVTIATNMAGRGTDIILGGNIDFKIRKKLYNILVFFKNEKKLNYKISIFPLKKKLEYCSQKFLSVLSFLLQDNNFINLSDIDVLKFLNKNDIIRIPIYNYQYSIKFLLNELLRIEKKNQKLDNYIVKNLGGLYIIGTERNDSRRIDNQLRGRCGRQGDPGISRFFISIDDKIIRLFGNIQFKKVLNKQFLNDLPIESNFVTKVLDSAQKELEERNYSVRKNLFEYDEIVNKQRYVIYYERNKILKSKTVNTKILTYGEQLISDIINQLKKRKNNRFYLFRLIENLLNTEIKFTVSLKFFKKKKISFIELKKIFYQEFWLSYELKKIEFDIQSLSLINEFGRMLLLFYIDIEWKEHLQKMSLLRDAVGWRRYGQRNPLYEYKEDAYKLFKYRNLITRRLIIFELLYSYIL